VVCLLAVGCSLVHLATAVGNIQCPDNVVFVFDSLYNDRQPEQWKQVKKYAKNVVAFMPETPSRASKTRFAVVKYGPYGGRSNYSTMLNATDATDKNQVWKKIDGVKQDTEGVLLANTIHFLAISRVFGFGDETKVNAIIVFKDASSHCLGHHNLSDVLNNELGVYHPVILFTVIDDKYEHDDLSGLISDLNTVGRVMGVDAYTDNYQQLDTLQARFTVKQLQCEPLNIAYARTAGAVRLRTSVAMTVLAVGAAAVLGLSQL